MLGMSFGGMDATRARLEQMGSKIRRQVMQKVANEAAKPVQEYMRSLRSKDQQDDNIPIVGGTLAKSIGRKSKGYASGLVAFVAVGPRRGFRQTVTQRKDYRTGKIRQVTPSKKAGQRFEDPVKIAHLVGKGRKGLFRMRTARATLAQVKAAVMQTLLDEVARL